MPQVFEQKRRKTDAMEASKAREATAGQSASISNTFAAGLIAGAGSSGREVHRGYSPTMAWGGKYRYGTFSHLIAAYVLTYEFHDRLADLADWRQQGPERAGELISAMKARYESLSPGEVEMIVELANRGLIGETFEAHWWPVRDPVENLDFIENVMADFSELQAAPGIDASRLTTHPAGTDGGMRLTLEPMDDWLSSPDFRGLEPDLHRGGYTPGLSVPHNSILGHLIAYLAGDRGVEMDILDTADYKNVVVHDFALNRLTGEYFLPKKFASKMTGEQVSAYHLGIPHVDRNSPNAMKSEFPITFLNDFLDFHKNYTPGMHRALDARNFSSVTAIDNLISDMDDTTNNEGYNPSISLKVYPFTISHGYEHMLYEYAARAGEGRAHIGDLNFEEMKYFKPAGFDEAGVRPEYLTVAEKEKAKKRLDLQEASSALARGEDKRKEFEDLSGAVSRFEKLETFPEVSDAIREEFASKSKRVHVILCVGQVSGAAIDDAQKSVGYDTPIDATKIARSYQGSESVVALAVQPKFADEDWKADLPYGGRSESYYERELISKHGMSPFTENEREFLLHETFRLFQWIATFMGKVHPKSGIQFQASASIPDVLDYTENVGALRSDSRRFEEGLSGDAAAAYRNAVSGSDYLGAADFSASGLGTRFKLLSAAVIQNVQHLIAKAADGRLKVITSAKEDNADEVRAGFAGLYYYGTDRFPDMILPRRAATAEASGAESVLSDIGERLGWRALGNTPPMPTATDAAKRWVYFVVEGKVNPQAGPGFSNQLGGTTGQTLGVSAATTDMSVPHRMLAAHGVLHAGLPSARKYWDHMRTVFRPDIRTDEAGDPAGIARWAGNPFMKDTDLAAKLGVPVDQLQAYAAPEGMEDQATKRKRVVDAVKEAR